MPIIKYIDDISDECVSEYRNLKEKRSKSQIGSAIFIAETRTVILNAIQSGCQPISFLMAEKYINGRDKELLGLFPQATVYTAPDAVLEKLIGYSLTRGILSAMTWSCPYDENALINNSSRLAILENVQDASNIGAILRSASGLGIDAVILDTSCCSPLHRKAIRTSMGAVFKVPWVQSDKPGWMLAEILKENKYRTLAFALSDNAVSLRNVFLSTCNERIALFFGSEGNGLDPRTIEACNQIVKIPMANDLDSLNVAATAAIAFWESNKSQ